ESSAGFAAALRRRSLASAVEPQRLRCNRVSRCRSTRPFRPEGRRGGQCKRRRRSYEREARLVQVPLRRRAGGARGALLRSAAATGPSARMPKGQIDVNVQQGVVQLRGEVPNSDMLNDLVEKTRRVQGVR